MINDPNADAGSAAAQIPLQGSGVQVPNSLQNMEKAYTLADLVQRTQILGNEATTSNLQTQDALATRQALTKNTRQDPNTGMMAIDFGGTLKDLAKVSPTAAVNFQLSMQQRQAELAEKQATLQQTQLGNSLSRVNLVGQLVQHVNSQKDLDMVRDEAHHFGIDPQMIPEKFDATERDQLISQSVKTSEMLNNKIEMGRLQLTAAKNTSEIIQADAAAANEVAGQYKDDPFTKEYINTANTYQTYKSMESTKDFSQGIKDRDLLYNFQNMINPNRSATGGTIEQDEQARSYFGDAWVTMVQKVTNGGTLTPAQRQQISAFVEDKYKRATLQQQAVFNQAQNRLINLRAMGRNVDPYHTLPMYGSVVDHVSPGAENFGGAASNKNMDETTTNGMANLRNATEKLLPTVSADQLQPPNDMKVAAKVIGMDQIIETAKKYGKTADQVAKDVKAKGYTIEGQ